MKRWIKKLFHGSSAPANPFVGREDDPTHFHHLAVNSASRMVEVVSATRLSERDFWNRAPLGISLKRLQDDPRLFPTIIYENKRGLPEIYNQCLDTGGDAIVVFIHDDVWIDDYHFCDRVIAGLQCFDVIGVAGNRNKSAGQTSWIFLKNTQVFDKNENLSGAVAHGNGPFGEVSSYGATPASCELLDGVLLAASKPVLLSAGVKFDPLFNFHFYDLDFCRTARQQQLRLGTYPICITHESDGATFSAPWQQQRELYQQKWGEVRSARFSAAMNSPS